MMNIDLEKFAKFKSKFRLELARKINAEPNDRQYFALSKTMNIDLSKSAPSAADCVELINNRIHNKIKSIYDEVVKGREKRRG